MRYVKYLSGLALLILIGVWSIPKPDLMSERESSKLYFSEEGQLLRMELTRDEKFREIVPLEKISLTMIEATLLQEDQYFYHHLGVNPLSLVRGIVETYFKSSRRMGGSTITMQLARIRFGLKSSTVTGKFQQILRAIQLERHFTKNQILEAYLNLAPYGGNIEGVGAAARVYYHKSAYDLTLPEALALSVVPQNPNRRNPLRGTMNEIQKARQKLFERWVQKYPEDAHKRAWISLPMVVYAKKELPFLAPHFVDQVRDQQSSETRIQTTLNAQLQQQVEKILHGYVEKNSVYGLENASALLVDTRTMEVKVLVGSADFANETIDGQVNGTASFRSPGSTLKPFIYALALDQGVIHPRTMLKDAPMSFGEYNPENVDGAYKGPLPAHEALARSRNIPAIFLNTKLGDNDLYDFMGKAGISHLKSRKHYGLALVLGGAEISMQQLAMLYGGLANDGVFKSLAMVKNQAQHAEKLLSAESAFLTLSMVKVAGDSTSFLNRSNELPVYWKTGTSNGYRDGWAAGVFGPYVLIVWVGNFDSTANRFFSGTRGAKPLFFEIIRSLSAQGDLKDLQAEKLRRLNIKKVNVCEHTGDIGVAACRTFVPTFFIPGKSPIASSNVFRKVLIDKETGLRACVFDPDRTHYETFEFWPSDVLRIYHAAGIYPKSPPPYLPSCKNHAMVEHMSPEITSPKEGIIYTFQAGKKNPVALTATVDASVKKVFWFVGNQFVSKSSPDTPYLWMPTPGLHEVRIVDDKGKSDTKRIVVRPLG